jgi:gliding motility-associated-like protein
VRISDGKDFSAPFPLTVNLELPSAQPRINAQTPLFTDEDVPLTISFNDLDVIDTDDFYPTGFRLNIVPGANYTVDGMTIIPAANYSGFIEASITVNDGDQNSDEFLLKVYVIPVNDRPVITVLESNAILYEPGSGPVNLTEAFSLEDVDNDFIALAEVSIDSGYSPSNDELIFENSPTSPIRTVYDESTGTLSMLGYASKEEYIEAIRSIKYNYKLTIDDDGEQSAISTEPKKIFISVNDGQLISEKKGRSIDLETSVDLDIPNAFTPDGKGANETWAVQPLTNSDQFDRTVVRVFNKRGLLIYESVGLENEWDGTFNGEQLPADTYYYTIDLHLSFIKKTYKGFVMILR